MEIWVAGCRLGRFSHALSYPFPMGRSLPLGRLPAVSSAPRATSRPFAGIWNFSYSANTLHAPRPSSKAPKWAIAVAKPARSGPGRGSGILLGFSEGYPCDFDGGVGRSREARECGRNTCKGEWGHETIRVVDRLQIAYCSGSSAADRWEPTGWPRPFERNARRSLMAQTKHDHVPGAR